MTEAEKYKLAAEYARDIWQNMMEAEELALKVQGLGVNKHVEPIHIADWQTVMELEQEWEQKSKELDQ
jgi:hypothetical protein